MSDTRQSLPLRTWRGYVVVWIVLVGVVLATVAFSYMPLGRAQSALHLALALIQIVLIWVVFMNLRRASALIRLAACSAALWLVFMFALTYTDYFSR
jgi:cytochrome c oxidase subunit IV